MTFHCIGLNPLLNYVCSGIFSRDQKINYIIYNNLAKNITLETLEFQASLARSIAASLGYTVEIKGPYNWFCPDINERGTLSKLWRQPADVSVADGDVITSNAVGFLKAELKNRNVRLFPEGASCLDILIRQMQENGRIVFRVNLKKIKNFFWGRQFNILSQFLIPDGDDIIRKAAETLSSCEVLNRDTLNQNYKEVSSYIWNEFDLPKIWLKFNVFHAPFSMIDDSDYNLFLESQKKILNKKLILIKSKDRDNRSYTKFFEQVGAFVEEVPDKYRNIPAELFLVDRDMIYYGFFSTISLNLPKSRCFLEEFPNGEVFNAYRRVQKRNIWLNEQRKIYF